MGSFPPMNFFFWISHPSHRFPTGDLRSPPTGPTSRGALEISATMLDKWIWAWDETSDDFPMIFVDPLIGEICDLNLNIYIYIYTVYIYMDIYIYMYIYI